MAIARANCRIGSSGAVSTDCGDEPMPVRYGQLVRLRLQARQTTGRPNTSAACPVRSWIASISSSTCRQSCSDDERLRHGKAPREAATRVAAARIQLARYANSGSTASFVTARVFLWSQGLSRRSPKRRITAIVMQPNGSRLSARVITVLACARTLADLDGGGPTRRMHLAEALSYRGAPDRAIAAA